MPNELLTAIALIFVIEGALYALFPEWLKRVMARMLEQPVASIRTGGFVAMVIGVGMMWVFRG